MLKTKEKLSQSPQKYTSFIKIEQYFTDMLHVFSKMFKAFSQKAQHTIRKDCYNEITITKIKSIVISSNTAHLMAQKYMN